MGKKLSDLPNIGKELEKLLESVGVSTPEELISLGSVEVCRRLKSTGDFCYNKLYALEGAVQGIRWHDLPKEYRAELKRCFDEVPGN